MSWNPPTIFLLCNHMGASERAIGTLPPQMITFPRHESVDRFCDTSLRLPFSDRKQLRSRESVSNAAGDSEAFQRICTKNPFKNGGESDPFFTIVQFLLISMYRVSGTSRASDHLMDLALSGSHCCWIRCDRQ
jgi:hypothetical protein